MTYIKRNRVLATVTATGGGAQTFYSNQVMGGFVEAIRYTRGIPVTTTALISSASGFATNAHLAITAEQSGLSIWDGTATETNTWYPRAAVINTTNGVLGFTSAATPPPLVDKIPVAQERVKIVVSSGGSASNGGTRAIFDFYISGGG